MCVSGHDSGPVFEEQPSSLIYPEGLTEGKVTLSCQARANPAASYRCLTFDLPIGQGFKFYDHYNYVCGIVHILVPLIWVSHLRKGKLVSSF